MGINSFRRRIEKFNLPGKIKGADPYNAERICQASMAQRLLLKSYRQTFRGTKGVGHSYMRAGWVCRLDEYQQRHAARRTIIARKSLANGGPLFASRRGKRGEMHYEWRKGNFRRKFHTEQDELD